MKSSHFLLLLVLVTGLLVFPDEVLARAGGGSAKGAGIMGIILAPFFIIYSAIVTYIASKKNKQCKALLETAASRDNFWEIYAIKARIEEAYFKVQQAWMDRNQDIAKEYMSQRLYRKHKMQTDRMLANGTRNVMKNVSLKDAKLVEILDFEDDSKDSFWVLIHGSMIDYLVSDKTGAVLDGEQKTLPFKELWRFKREQHGWVLDEIDQDVSISDLNAFESKVESLT